MAATDPTTDIRRLIWTYLESVPFVRCPVFSSDMPYDVTNVASVAAHSFKTPTAHTPADLIGNNTTAGVGFIVIHRVDETGRAQLALSGAADLGAGITQIESRDDFFTVSFAVATPQAVDQSVWRGHMHQLEDDLRGRVLKPVGFDNPNIANRPQTTNGPRFRQRHLNEDFDPWYRNFHDSFWTRHIIEPLNNASVTEVAI